MTRMTIDMPSGLRRAGRALVVLSAAALALGQVWEASVWCVAGGVLAGAGVLALAAGGLLARPDRGEADDRRGAGALPGVRRDREGRQAWLSMT